VTVGTITAGAKCQGFVGHGIYVNARLEDPENRRQCMLVLMGATPDGRKELIAVVDGYRESEQSWHELLRLPIPPSGRALF